ncbi:MAG: hypothetical protein K6F50_05125 [Kiritimatiellae bacterium]|nr:hypothetical protein [Kiritimatiellia bacterium]
MRPPQNVDVPIVSNRYDHLGRRVQKITPEATYTYFYDGWILVKEVVERSGDTRRCGVSPRHCGGAGRSTSLGRRGRKVPFWAWGWAAPGFYKMRQTCREWALSDFCGRIVYPSKISD